MTAATQIDDLVPDYLRRLEWDGVRRLDTWVPRLLGARDTPYHRLVGRYMLVAAVARAFDPGCKVTTVVLVGAPGVGKSQAIEALTGGVGARVYSDAPIDSKKCRDALCGTWLHEWTGPLTSKAEAFMLLRADRYRLPYAKVLVEVPRRCVFVVTALVAPRRDAQRRWPVTVGSVDLVSLRQEVDQLWAEARVAYETTPRWWPTDEESPLFTGHAEDGTASPMSSRGTAKDAYDRLRRAHGDHRVAVLAHVVQEAQFNAGATDGLFWDDLALALIWVLGEDAPSLAARRMAERAQDMISRTGHLLRPQVVADAREGRWPWQEDSDVTEEQDVALDPSRTATRGDDT